MNDVRRSNVAVRGMKWTFGHLNSHRSAECKPAAGSDGEMERWSDGVTE